MKTACVTVGQRIREIRKRQKLTIEKLADLSNVAYHNLADIEHGKVDPRINTIEKIARALDVPITDLFLKSGSSALFSKNNFMKKCEALSESPKTVERYLKNLIEIENLFL